MRWSSNRLSIAIVFALIIGTGPARSTAQTVENSGPARAEALRPDDARERFERAVIAAQRELEDREAPALAATLASRVAWVFATLRAKAARAERDAYDPLGYHSRRQALRHDIDDKKGQYERIKAEVDRMEELIEFGKRVSHQQRALLWVKRSEFEVRVQLAEAHLDTFELIEAPRRRLQLSDQLVQASVELTKAELRCHGQSERLRRKMKVLEQLLGCGSAWIGRLLRSLKTPVAVMTPPSGLARAPSNVQAGRSPRQPKSVEARRDIVKTDVSQLVLASAKWFALISGLAKSLLVLDHGNDG